MVASESENSPDGMPDSDELSQKLARLSDEKRQKYETQIAVATDKYGTVTPEYKLGLAKTYLQALPPEIEKIQVNDHNRREHDRAFASEQKNARVSTSPGHENHEQNATAHPATEPTNKDKPQVREGKYAELQRTHKQIAASEQSEPTQNNAPQALASKHAELQRTHEQVAANKPYKPSLLSRDELEAMASHYAEMRKAGGFELTPSELRERNDQTKLQSAARDKLDRTLASAPESEQKEQRALLEHQHFAERVSDEARSISRELRRQVTPGAEFYERDARNAIHTAHQVYEARGNLGVDKGRAQETSRTLQQQDQHRQSAAQEAARGGRSLTSEQMANAPSDIKETIQQKERTETDRNATGGSREQSAPQGNSKPGNTRGGGRSR